jgi:hypothetical protein
MDRVDSFDSILPEIRAKGRWLGSKIQRLSSLLAVNVVDNKQGTQSSSCCMLRIASLAADDDVGGRGSGDDEQTT